MFPDLQPKNKKKHSNNAEYEDAMIELLIDSNYPDDGYTNQNGIGCVRALNGYIYEAGALIVQASIIRKAVSDYITPNEYENENIKKLSNTAVTNLSRIIRIADVQRSMAFSIKQKCKYNEVPKRWVEIIRKWISRMQERINRINTAIIPDNIKVTPIVVYQAYLTKNETTFQEDMDCVLPSNLDFYRKDIFDENITEICTNHIREVTEDLPEKDLILKLLEEERNKHAALLEKRKEDEEKETIEKEKEIMDSIRTDLMDVLCMQAKNASLYYRKKCDDIPTRSLSRFYIVLAIPLKKSAIENPHASVRYAKALGKAVTADIRYASKFVTREDAENAAKLFKSLRKTEHFTEIAEIEIE